jgi:hypothetical protein
MGLSMGWSIVGSVSTGGVGCAGRATGLDRAEGILGLKAGPPFFLNIELMMRSDKGADHGGSSWYNAEFKSWYEAVFER